MLKSLLKFFRRGLLSLVIILFLIFAGVTFAGYYFLDDIAARMIGPKISAAPKSKKPKVIPPRPLADEAPVDADEALLIEELNKAEDMSLEDEVEAAPAIPRESQVDLLDYYDFIRETQTHTEQKPLCEIICERARFYPGKDDLALQNIKNFFDGEKSKEKAFNDPAFRIALVNLSLTTDLFPKEVRNIILDIEKVQSMSPSEKLLFVFNSEIEIAKFVIYVRGHQKENRQLKKQLDEIQKLQRQCSSKNKGASQELCTTLNTAGW